MAWQNEHGDWLAYPADVQQRIKACRATKKTNEKVDQVDNKVLMSTSLEWNIDRKMQCYSGAMYLLFTCVYSLRVRSFLLSFSVEQPHAIQQAILLSASSPVCLTVCLSACLSVLLSICLYVRVCLDPAKLNNSSRSGYSTLLALNNSKSL